MAVLVARSRMPLLRLGVVLVVGGLLLGCRSGRPSRCPWSPWLGWQPVVRPPEGVPAFGEPVFTPADGVVVVRARDRPRTAGAGFVATCRSSS
jgi:hypothetical protein